MANVTLTVPNKNGSYDGDMVVKQYTSLTINSGDTLTVDQPCRGLLIYVQGNCVINGSLTMTARGPYANPTTSGGSDNSVVDSNGLRFPFRTSGGSDTLTAASTLLNGCGTVAQSVISNHVSLSGNGTVLTSARQGANGGNSRNGSNLTGNSGSSGTNQTGGGGGGGAHDNGTSGSGSYGSCWGGGSGGGGTRAATGTNATAWGGPGGGGRDTGGYGRASGGTGNPGGDYTVASGTGQAGYDGTGGLIVLIVGGDLTIGSSGGIYARGTDGINGHEGGGGASGGGRIMVAYKGTYTNNGSGLTVTGGVGVNAPTGISATGGNGGAGDADIIQVL